MSWKRKTWLLLGTVAAIFLFMSNRPGIYCKNYNAVVNRADNQSYEAIISENGPVKMIEFKENTECIYYEDGRIFVFWIAPSGNRSFCRVDITSEQYRFGRKQIGVGTTRKQIESVYKGGKNKYSVQGNHIQIVENNVAVGFYFNDQDVVCEMYVGEPDIYE